MNRWCSQMRFLISRRLKNNVPSVRQLSQTSTQPIQAQHYQWLRFMAGQLEKQFIKIHKEILGLNALIFDN